MTVLRTDGEIITAAGAINKGESNYNSKGRVIMKYVVLDLEMCKVPKSLRN